LEANKNREIADKTFRDKEKIYHTSKYAMRKIIDASEWNINAIKSRQSKLANIACGIWKIQYN